MNQTAPEVVREMATIYSLPNEWEDEVSLIFLWNISYVYEDFSKRFCSNEMASWNISKGEQINPKSLFIC